MAVMVWAAFSWNGTTDIVFIDGRLNSLGYRKILEDHLLPKAVEIGGQSGLSSRTTLGYTQRDPF
jgi:hypothetical protein